MGTSLFEHRLSCRSSCARSAVPEGNRRTRRLGASCGAPTPAGAQAIKRLINGYHPMLRRGTNGRAAERAAATIVATYDASAKTWTSVQPANLQQPAPGGDQTSEDNAWPCVDEAPHANQGDMMDETSEDDVFGHGGALDEATQGVAGLGAEPAMHAVVPLRSRPPRTTPSYSSTSLFPSRPGDAPTAGSLGSSGTILPRPSRS